MRFKTSAAAGLVAMACLAAACAHAATGTVELTLSAKVDAHAVEMGETTVTAAGGSGTLTIQNSSGRPFLDGTHAGFRFAGLTRATPSGREIEADALATFGPDDTLMLVFERHASDAGAPDEGRLHLAGGSGRFAGVTGECRYRLEEPPGQWNVTARCEWLYVFPYR
jgi:hypothetical protein